MNVTENDMLGNGKTFVPIWEKYILTIGEASEYFSLGEKSFGIWQIFTMIQGLYCKMEAEY